MTMPAKPVAPAGFDWLRCVLMAPPASQPLPVRIAATGAVALPCAPHAWLDEQLQRCSPGARGLLMELLMLYAMGYTAQLSLARIAALLGLHPTGATGHTRLADPRLRAVWDELTEARLVGLRGLVGYTEAGQHVRDGLTAAEPPTLWPVILQPLLGRLVYTAATPARVRPVHLHASAWTGSQVQSVSLAARGVLAEIAMRWALRPAEVSERWLASVLGLEGAAVEPLVAELCAVGCLVRRAGPAAQAGIALVRPFERELFGRELPRSGG